MPHVAVIVGVTVVAVGVALAVNEFVVRPWWEEMVAERRAAAACRSEYEMGDKDDGSDESGDDDDGELSRREKDRKEEEDVWTSGAAVGPWRADGASGEGLRKRGSVGTLRARGSLSRSSPPRPAPIPVPDPISFDDFAAPSTSRTIFPDSDFDLPPPPRRSNPYDASQDLLTGSTHTIGHSSPASLSRRSSFQPQSEGSSGRGLDIGLESRSAAVARDPFSDDGLGLALDEEKVDSFAPTIGATTHASGSVLSAPNDSSTSNLDSSMSPFVSLSPALHQSPSAARAVLPIISSSSNIAFSSPFISADARSVTPRSPSLATDALPSGFATPVSVGSRSFSVVSVDESPMGSPDVRDQRDIGENESEAGSEAELVDVEDLMDGGGETGSESEAESWAEVLSGGTGRRADSDDEYVM